MRLDTNTFDRLKEPTLRMIQAFGKESEVYPGDASILIAMVCAYMLNTQRADGVSLDTAQTVLFDLITAIAALGEKTTMTETENTERFSTKAEAERCREQLLITGFDSKIYKGHRAYVVQWWVPDAPSVEVGGRESVA